MKNLRRFGPVLVLGLTIALAGVSFAQSAKQATSDDKHSCCMSSGCCGDSCQMKKEGAKNHVTSTAKGCCGDSCHMKDGATAKAASDKHQCCCCGDTCNMKHMKHTKDMKEKP